MKQRLIWTSIVSTAVLSACASAPTVDYSKADAECVRLCKKNDAECHTRFAEFPTVLYTHCAPELRDCLKACPEAGTVPAPTASTTTPANSNSASDKPSIADRLKQLEELHKSGMITDKEYTDKRQEIIKSL